jgi:hypothetical protein
MGGGLRHFLPMDILSEDTMSQTSLGNAYECDLPLQMTLHSLKISLEKTKGMEFLQEVPKEL